MQTRGTLGLPTSQRYLREKGDDRAVKDEGSAVKLPPPVANGGRVGVDEKKKMSAIEQEIEAIRQEDSLKENIPSLLQRPVILPRQTMNNLTSGLYWAYGSWGRVVATSSACWAYPTVDSFAMECKRKLLPPTVLMRLEYLNTLDIVRTLCVTCSKRQRAERRVVIDDIDSLDTATTGKGNQSSGSGGGIVRVMSTSEAKLYPPGAKVSDSESSTFRVRDGVIPVVATRTSSIAIDSQESCKRAGTFPNTCIIAIDVMFRVRPSSSKRQSQPSSQQQSPSSASSSKQQQKKSSTGPTPPEVCFITIGDWGGDIPEKRWVAETLTKIVQRRMVKFIISTGDNFYPTGVQSVNDKLFLDIFEKPYRDVGLQRIRWFIIAGNHDQWGLPPQKEYSLEHPRWYFPSFHYNESIPLYRDVRKSSRETIELAVLNTAGREMWQQCDMLDDFFAHVEERHGGYLHDMSRHWRMVANHEPLYSGVFFFFFLPYMQQSLVHAYFNGDDHFLEVHRSQGTDYFVSGAGGGTAMYYVVEETPKTAKFQLKAATHETITGFMLHCIKDDVMITTLVDGATGEAVFIYKTKYVVNLKEFGLEK
ncbi:tartrate-resistant acid phosphatase type 5, putative [Bodo saltans]|uniref:Tartrate-resistant acid phosphatase type 5, putative n=1 Tax=Bodo saltans TaxID=75058 RepID=A0A0S4IQ69_BODSA|nr:tartrate-resistant acid phosphatase type 5, putative [Bodo saltans]|eukprot:CUE82493.1 tartrate-resistant acid phosphatase type 5, putative [Bodo saltans]